VRQLGSDLRFDVENARAALYVRSGRAAETGLPGTRRVAFAPGLEGRERQELARLRQQLGDYIEQGRVHVDGKRVVDASPLFESRELVRLVEEDHLQLDGEWAPRFARYAELQTQADRGTVAVFVGPIDAKT
jgi:hypothetical protein